MKNSAKASVNAEIILPIKGWASNACRRNNTDAKIMKVKITKDKYFLMPFRLIIFVRLRKSIDSLYLLFLST